LAVYSTISQSKLKSGHYDIIDKEEKNIDILDLVIILCYYRTEQRKLSG
jgi:hypothetical protein